MSQHPTALIVTGPTCSGKSALALRLAQSFNGQIINADSMQVYADLKILTARPTAEDERIAPHALYGVVDAKQCGNVAWWREQAIREMQHAQDCGRLPILCGGTGMYLRAMLEGLACLPTPDPVVREEARSYLKNVGAPGLYALLTRHDPETAEKLKPSDGQRLARAWEIWRSTGHGLSWWHRQPGLPPPAFRFSSIRFNPPRTTLRSAIELRFHKMLAAGAIDEVETLLARNLPPELPVMRAHGVPELAAMLAGKLSFADAFEKSVIAQSRYIRRQATWFSHHKLTQAEDEVILLQRFGDKEKDSDIDERSLETFIQSRLTSLT